MKRWGTLIIVTAIALGALALPASAKTTVWGPYHDPRNGLVPCGHHDSLDWQEFPWQPTIQTCFNADGSARYLNALYSANTTGLYPEGWDQHPVFTSLKVIPWGSGQAYYFRSRVKAWPCADLKCRATIVEAQAIAPYRGPVTFQYLIDR
jgi:hypothetical protein